MSSEASFHDGGCTCRSVRYRMTTKPLFVHCCHCRWCQRESGTSFALNAMIESDRVQLLQGQPELVDTPSLSGAGQKIARCPKCRVAVWSHYAGAGEAVCFVRVGTLDAPDRLPPDIHIFTASKQPWVVLAPHVPAVAEYYKAAERWPKESLERRAMLRARSQQESRERADNRSMIRICDIDHLVLRVVDLERMLSFYCGALGCVVERRQDAIGLVQLRAGRSLIDLVPVDGKLGAAGGAPPAKHGRNLDHFCLRVEPFDDAGIRRHLQAHGIAAGPVESRYGAQGEGPSIYLSDPEGNGVELKGPPADVMRQGSAPPGAS